MQSYQFVYDERLGISLPLLSMEWEQYALEMRESILMKWELQRGRIPERIGEIEQEINRKQAQLSDEENFEQSCRLNSEIAELASIIHDLWIWYRVRGEIAVESSQT